LKTINLSPDMVIAAGTSELGSTVRKVAVFGIFGLGRQNL